MNTQNIFHIPARPAFSVSLLRGVMDAPSTKKDAALYFLKHPVRLLVGMCVYSLEEGDVLLVPPFTHVATAEKNTELCACCISFPYDVLSDFSPRALFRSADGGAAFRFSRNKRELMEELFLKLESASLLPSLLLSALFAVLEEDDVSEEDTSLLIPLPKILRQAMKYLNVYYNEVPNTAELAARYGVSQSTLARLFRSYLATTPLSYAKAIAALRLEEQSR